MAAALVRNLGHAGAQIEPKLRIALAKANRRRPTHQRRKPKCCQHRLVETGGAIEVRDADGDVVNHE
jgi:hypothetical protein